MSKEEKLPWILLCRCDCGDFHAYDKVSKDNEYFAIKGNDARALYEGVKMILEMYVKPGFALIDKSSAEHFLAAVTLLKKGIGE